MQTQVSNWGAGAALACGLALILLAPGAARAQATAAAHAVNTADTAIGTMATTAANTAANTLADTANPFAQPIDASQLASLRGGSQNVHNDMSLSGTTADNSAYQVSTGSNAISAGSFANMAGIPVVIQNTGANVLIQNAVILHLQMN